MSPHDRPARASSRDERGQGSLEITGIILAAALLVGATVMTVTSQSTSIGSTISTAICQIVTMGQGDCGSPDTDSARTPDDYRPTEPCVVSGSGSSTSGQVSITFVKINGSEGWLIEELSDGTYRLTRVDEAGIGATAGIGFGASVTLDGDRMGLEAQAGVSSSLVAQGGESYVADSLEEAQEILAQKGTDDTKDFWLGDDNLLRDGWDGLFGEGEHEEREPDEWFVAAGQETEGSANATLLNGDAGVEGSVESYLGTRHRSDGTSTEYFHAKAEISGSAGVVVAGAGFELGGEALVEVDRDDEGNPTTMRVVATKVADGYAYDDPANQENPEVEQMTVEIPLTTQEGRDLASRYMWATGLPVQGVFPDVGSDESAIPFVDAMDVTEDLVAFAARDGRMWSSTFTEDVSTNGVNLIGKLGAELGGSAEWSETSVTTTDARFYDGTGWSDRPECAA